jgi:hypothetical protein
MEADGSLFIYGSFNEAVRNSEYRPVVPFCRIIKGKRKVIPVLN